MLSQFTEKLTLIDQKSVTRRFIFGAMVVFQMSLTSLAFAEKPAWYRYYDSKGVANISTNVTPNHIRYGYEALDANMRIIQRARPYNVEKDLKQAPQRAEQARQTEADNKLKRAYNNSQVATQKKKDALLVLKKQIAFQQGELKQIQNDRVMFVRQEREFVRKGTNVPDQLKNTLHNNQKNIVAKKESIQSLQTRYRDTEAEYNRIIARLKTFE